MQIVNGKEIADEIYAKVHMRLGELKQRKVIPKMVTILVGDDEASKVYVGKKMEMAKKMDIMAEKVEMPADSSTMEVATKVEEVCNDESVNGVLIQLPLPEQIDTAKILRALDPAKDIDGFHAYNLGKLVSGFEDLPPATPAGIVWLLEHEKTDLLGLNVVVVGASLVVGRTLAIQLINRGATVTICNEYTKDLAQATSQADVLVSATGKAGLIKAEHVKEGAFVIDVGFSREGNKLMGDVDREAVEAKAGKLTPVPGGVGPITVASLLYNLVHAVERQRDPNKKSICILK